MLMSIVAVRDSAIGQYMNPFVTPAVGGAIRSFSDEVNRVDASNAMNKHPSDYELYELATYSPDTGVIVPMSPRLLLRGKDCLNSTPIGDGIKY